jgi:hypothetical protein
MFLIYFLVAIAATAVASMCAAIASRRPLGDFRCIDACFVAPLRRSWQISSLGTGLCFLILGAGYLTEGPDPVITTIGVLMFWGFGALALWIVLGSVTSRSRVVIRRDGVELRGTFVRRFRSWSDLTDPMSLHRAGLRVPGQQAVRPKVSDGVELRALDVQPGRVLAAIAYYRDNPESRSAIGSPTELARMT